MWIGEFKEETWGPRYTKMVNFLDFHCVLHIPEYVLQKLAIHKCQHSQTKISPKKSLFSLAKGRIKEQLYMTENGHTIATLLLPNTTVKMDCTLHTCQQRLSKKPGILVLSSCNMAIKLCQRGDRGQVRNWIFHLCQVVMNLNFLAHLEVTGWCHVLSPIPSPNRACHTGSVKK